MEHTWYVAAVWIGLELLASVISMQTAISVALIEICVGVVGGNFLGLDPKTEWVSFLAGFGAILLTFLAGAEIEPEVLRKYGKESIGFLSFLLPFLGSMAYAYYIAKWTLDAAMICGTALSTPSVAVVYAVIVQTGLNKEELGKPILAACFVTDLGTVVALGICFAHYDIWLVLFAVITTIVLCITPWFIPLVFQDIQRMFFKRLAGAVVQRLIHNYEAFLSEGSLKDVTPSYG